MIIIMTEDNDDNKRITCELGLHIYSFCTSFWFWNEATLVT